MDVRLLHVRRMELAGRVLQYKLHLTPHVHLRGSLLRDCKVPTVPHSDDQTCSSLHATGLLGLARHHILRTNLQRLVHNGGEQRAPPQASRTLRVQGQ